MSNWDLTRSFGCVGSEMQNVSVLATDMDGTFIPLEGNEENRRDLEILCHELQKRGLELVYVTGRHYELVLDAIRSHSLPEPRWLVCDVGTSIYESAPDGGHRTVAAYDKHLAEIVGRIHVGVLQELFSSVSELRIQEHEKQGQFKLSYYCDAEALGPLNAGVSQTLQDSRAPYRVIASVDPFTGEGLIDFLPEGVSKDYALRWWVDHTHRDEKEVVFAGDSGNDLAALTAGYRSIVVANADPSVAHQARLAHQSAGWTDRLFLAAKPATSGVLEGLNHFANSKCEPKP